RDLERLGLRLWPHQRQGIAQALWVLDNVGSVLIADSPGSGKTRMGAWLLRAIHDRTFRLGVGAGVPPLLFAPPQALGAWADAVDEAGLPGRQRSHGELSQPPERVDPALLEAIGRAEVLAVDEAHNYLRGTSLRTIRLLGHYAD